MGFLSSLKSFFSSSFHTLEGARPLSDAEQRGLALGAVHAAEGSLPMNALTMEADQRTAARLLAGAWDVHGPQDVENTYAFLLTEGHRGYYAVVGPAVEATFEQRLGRRESEAKADEVAAQAAARGLDGARAREWYLGWLAAAKVGGHGELVDPLPASIVAWDAARVVHVSRLLVDAGFVDEARAYAAIAQAVDLARPAYASWKDFGDAFCVGRAFWKASNMRDPLDSEIGKFTSATRSLLEQEDSPWLTVRW
ncbi:DUF1266 domain-containing protein [Cellulomonas iranensis]|uniref:DUF1266 domain-containing protein n=1 Tax=Cellulomonas iranensis TaxID=76862 RepID=A0ABU0GKS4_9CELL|nr:DUF1266 domain-containing protein [Cellulomonas iranensis]MDQ0425167.1 hypothetical protein [Cellulomonas iranensis]